jgi:class 3 adenylate cyclase
MEPTIRSSSEEALKGLKISFLGLYLRNLGANLFGFVTIVILNVFTPLSFFKMHRVFIFTEGGWISFFLFFPVVMILIDLLQFYVQRPISHLSTLMGNEKETPVRLQEHAGQRLLNLPIIIALINLVIYIFVPIIVASAFYLFRDIPVRICLFLFFRVLMIGLISTGISFFVVEDYLRKTLIPLFFPKGKLAALHGTIKIPILRRIRLLNMAGTLNPMIILVVTFLFVVWETGESAISADLLGREILLFTFILCGAFVAITLKLNVLVGNSILNPIGEFLGVVERVKGGDFNQRIRVLSNDEIGVLGDAGNDMIRGLADRERIREAFGKYVTPEIRDQILAGRIPLNGERRMATLVFSDLRDFTSYVEENPSEEVISSMRAYFTAMQKAISAHQGLVLQYVGDEVEAVFGVPLRQVDHADKAVLAALKMRKSLEELNQHRIREGKAIFRHGIGICTGEVLAGNTGSEDRLSYALIGDTVNLASRIQGLTKIFHCDILVSEETVKMLDHSFHMQKELPQSVKGYSRPITVYLVLEQSYAS